MLQGRSLRIFTAMGLAVILVSNIFLFIPFTLYAGNIAEFLAPFSSMLGHYSPVAVFLIGLLGLLAGLMPAPVCRRYLVIVAAVAVLLWFQGNIVVWEYGLLDGHKIDWSDGTWRGWLDLGVWAGVLLVALFFHRRMGKPIIAAAVVTFSMQLVLFLFQGMQTASAMAEKSDYRPSLSALQEIYRFSSKQNILHLVVDGFQSDVFAQLVTEDEDGKRLASELEGFVFFENHTGAFPLTHMSVPALLSGNVYRNHIPRDDFLAENIDGKSIVDAAARAGFETDLASSPFLVGVYGKREYTNAYAIPPRNHLSSEEYKFDDAVRLLDLALFRLAPHFLKRYIYNDQLWLLQSVLTGAEYMQLEFFAHSAFLTRLRDNMSADREAAVYKMFHVMLVHKPLVTNSDCEYAGQVLEVTRKNVMHQGKCSLESVVGVLRKMKDLGIYDDALIVLMADHGAWVHPAGLIGRRRPNSSEVLVMNPTTVAMAVPLMAIKRPGATGPMQVSTAFSSITDTPATIASIMGLEANFGGTPIFDLKPGIPRERRTHVYKYSRSEWTSEYLSPIREFIINGSPFDSGSWTSGKWFLANGVVEER